MKLTRANYYTIKNRYITSSRIKDFLKDKRRFYEKHISGEYIAEPTPSMVLGSAIDAYVTGGIKEFNKKFCTLDRRKEDVPDGKTHLTKSQYEDAIKIATKLLSQPAIKDLKKHKTQVILSAEYPVGNLWSGFAGCLDWLGFSADGETAYITDLKSTTGVESARQWIYKCEDFSYFLQAGMYALLVRHNFPDVKYIEFRHIVVNKDSDDLFNCYTFKISQERLQHEAKKIMTEYLPAIASEKDFKPNEARWEDAVEIGSYDF